jgi:hypothetical protein
MATWPSTLPAPLNEGYSIEPQQQTIRTDMEVGNPRVRRRTAARVDNIPVAWMMTNAQFSAFRTWFDGDGEGGAAWFTVAIPQGDETSTEARFVDTFRAEKVAFTHWRITATLEVR